MHVSPKLSLFREINLRIEDSLVNPSPTFWMRETLSLIKGVYIVLQVQFCPD